MKTKEELLKILRKEKVIMMTIGKHLSLKELQNLYNKNN